MRVTSEFFVSALIKRANSDGAFAVLERRGAVDAGAIALKIEREDRLTSLLLPASQNFYETGKPQDRLFEQVLDFTDALSISARLSREIKRDPDLWIVSIEEKNGKYFVDLVKN
jgi:hypothetical protein